MSPREKKLLTLFAIAGFVMVNMLGFSFYRSKADGLRLRLQKAENTIDMLAQTEAYRDERLDEMDWLLDNLPEPTPYQNVQTELLDACEKEAGRYGLNITEQPMKIEMVPNQHFQRVGVRYRVSDREEKVYRWLNRIREPNALRGVTSIKLTPNKDPALIDCIVTIEQWYIPAEPPA